ncbi:NmrA-like domain-containing protein 1 [Serendipita sp. 398]|nr:NmrA-like domain-containing protein 1 [Serendipita sp. 398]
MSKPIIVVFAATGKSGAGMVEAILKDGTFQARAITRNPESSSAKALAAKGVEVVKADLSDPSTLAPAMEGAYGVFGVTDCTYVSICTISSCSVLVIITHHVLCRTVWQAFMAEEQQGKDMVDAAKQAGVKHFVWTTLDYSDWHVPHFETKARVDDYLKSSGVPRTSYASLTSHPYSEAD